MEKKTAEAILKEKYLHPLSKTEKQWIYEAMHEYAAQFEQKWVSIEEKLPENGERVMAYLEEYGCQIGWVNVMGFWNYTNGFLNNIPPTHWQELTTPITNQ